MSEHNYFGMAVKANLEKNPDFMKVDIAQIEAGAAKHRAAMAKLNPPKAEPIKLEYNKLRKAFYDWQQAARGTEVRLNDAVANVHHFDVIIADMLKKKKEAATDGRLGDERGWEHRLVAAESDLQSSRESLVKWQKENTHVARNLRTWLADNEARLKELEKQV